MFLAVTFRVKLTPGEGGALILAGLIFFDSACRTATMTAKRGKWRDHPGEGQGELAPSLTTEKMLSAIAEMSNIFLQNGQNIEIADKNAPPDPDNFGTRRGLTFYLT